MDRIPIGMRAVFSASARTGWKTMIIHRFTDKLVDNGVFCGESSILPTIWSALAIGGKDLLGIDLVLSENPIRLGSRIVG